MARDDARQGVELTYEQFLDSFGQKNDRILRGWLGDGARSISHQRIGDAKEARYRELRAEKVLSRCRALSSGCGGFAARDGCRR